MATQTRPEGKARSFGENIESDLASRFLRVVEVAAIASARTMGQGERKLSDQVATEAMRRTMDSIPMRGTSAGVSRRRSAGRTDTRSRTETTRKTAPSTHAGESVSQLVSAAANAPPPSITKNIWPVSASAPASTRANISQSTAAGMPPEYA